MIVDLVNNIVFAYVGEVIIVLNRYHLVYYYCQYEVLLKQHYKLSTHLHYIASLSHTENIFRYNF